MYTQAQLSIAYFCTSTEEGDYTAFTGTVTLTPTNDQQCVSVVIEDDSVLEETESLTVSLSRTGVVDSVQVSQQTTTIVITDDDSKRLISVHTYVCAFACMNVCTCMCTLF